MEAFNCIINFCLLRLLEEPDLDQEECQVMKKANTLLHEDTRRQVTEEIY